MVEARWGNRNKKRSKVEIKRHRRVELSVCENFHVHNIESGMLWGHGVCIGI